MDDIWLSKKLPTHWAARVLSESVGGGDPIDGPGVLAHLSYAPFTVTQESDDISATWEMASPPEPLGPNGRFDPKALKATHAVVIAHSDSGDPMMTMVACWSASEEPRVVVVMELDAEPPVMDDRGSLASWVSELVAGVIEGTDEVRLPNPIEGRLRERVTEIAKARLAAGAFIPPSWRTLPDVPDEADAPVAESAGNEVDALFAQLDDPELAAAAEASLHQKLTFESGAADVEALLDSIERAADAGGLQAVVAHELLETITIPAFGRKGSKKRWPAKIQKRVLSRIEHGIAADDPDVRAATIASAAAIDLSVAPDASPLRLLYPEGAERGANVCYDDRRAVGDKQGHGMDELVMRIVVLARGTEVGAADDAAAAVLWKRHPDAFWGRIRAQASGTLLVAVKKGSIPKWLQSRMVRAIRGEEPRSAHATQTILFSRFKAGRPVPASVKKALSAAVAEDVRVSRLLMYLSGVGIDDAESVVRACYERADDAGREEVVRLLGLTKAEPPWLAAFRAEHG